MTRDSDLCSWCQQEPRENRTPSGHLCRECREAFARQRRPHGPELLPDNTESLGLAERKGGSGE